MESENMPKHIAIIMDGNRRWAKQRGLPVALGHKKGGETVENIVRHANKIGLKYITVYAFSTENWKRAEDEVNALMLLFQSYIDKYSKIADSENVRVKFLGDLTAFSTKMQKGIQDCIERTKNNTGVTFNIAINYGGRAEMTIAAKRIVEEVQNGKLSLEDITEDTISQRLQTLDSPDPELIIRTGGEERLSGFLLWQSVYSELYFTDVLWPDFDEKELEKAIHEYQNRKRNFGK